MRTKYIVLEHSGPVLFSELLTHAEVARRIGGTVLGAGFCYLGHDSKYYCYGESTSLKITSRGKIDTDKLNRMFGLVDE
jgi:hypothetical protein